MNTPDDAAREEILHNWKVQLQAMDGADTDQLRQCFTQDAVLVHMTGYLQPLKEWLAGMRAGEFVYHQVVEHDVQVEVDGDKASLQGRITTGYRPDGSGQAWPLDVRQDLVAADGEWLVAESRVRLGSGLGMMRA
ncbi:hypothetical protein GCM10027030_28630 [Luteococcus sediminum]